MPSHCKRLFRTVFLNTARSPVSLPAPETVPTMAFVPKESWSSEVRCLFGCSPTEVEQSSQRWNCKLSLHFLVACFVVFFQQLDSNWFLVKCKAQIYDWKTTEETNFLAACIEMGASLNRAGIIAAGSDAFHVSSCWLMNKHGARRRMYADFHCRKQCWPGSVSCISSKMCIHSSSAWA